MQKNWALFIGVRAISLFILGLPGYFVLEKYYEDYQEKKFKEMSLAPKE